MCCRWVGGSWQAERCSGGGGGVSVLGGTLKSCGVVVDVLPCRCLAVVVDMSVLAALDVCLLHPHSGYGGSACQLQYFASLLILLA
jgi:hypothetical protein